MDRIRKVWTDPVWSKVIAGGIIAAIGWGIKQLGDALGAASQLLHGVVTAISFGFYLIAGALLISLLMYWRHARTNTTHRLVLANLAQKYQSNRIFCEIFLDGSNAESVYKRIGHVPEARNLMVDLASDNLLHEPNKPYPILNAQGKAVVQQLLAQRKVHTS